jgi:hypothetical protein
MRTKGDDVIEIENERVLALAIHVQMASEAMEEAARRLAALRPDGERTAECTAWTQAVDELAAMNVHLGFMRRILRRVVRGERRGLVARALSA